jgi:hypothetical protein
MSPATHTPGVSSKAAAPGNYPGVIPKAAPPSPILVQDDDDERLEWITWGWIPAKE